MLAAQRLLDATRVTDCRQAHRTSFLHRQVGAHQHQRGVVGVGVIAADQRGVLVGQ